MNQGSRYELAVAVHDAGAFPAISSYCYWNDASPTRMINVDNLDHALTEFKKQTGSNNLVLSFEIDDLLNADYQKLLMKHKPSHLEFVLFSSTLQKFSSDQRSIFKRPDVDWRTIKRTLEVVNKFVGAKILIRSTELKGQFLKELCTFDGIFAKGSEAAGMKGSMGTKEMFVKQREMMPDTIVVPVGGISTPSQVKEYIDLGAPAVVVGTLIAASLESPLHEDTKNAMVAADASMLTTFTELNQNALKFSAFTDHDDRNHTKSLITGAYKNPGKEGHVFAGAGITNVTSIKPVKEVIEYLVSELQ